MWWHLTVWYASNCMTNGIVFIHAICTCSFSWSFAHWNSNSIELRQVELTWIELIQLKLNECVTFTPIYTSWCVFRCISFLIDFFQLFCNFWIIFSPNLWIKTKIISYFVTFKRIITKKSFCFLIISAVSLSQNVSAAATASVSPASVFSGGASPSTLSALVSQHRLLELSRFGLRGYDLAQHMLTQQGAVSKLLGKRKLNSEHLLLLPKLHTNWHHFEFINHQKKKSIKCERHKICVLSNFRWEIIVRTPTASNIFKIFFSSVFTDEHKSWITDVIQHLKWYLGRYQCYIAAGFMLFIGIVLVSHRRFCRFTWIFFVFEKKN